MLLALLLLASAAARHGAALAPPPRPTYQSPELTPWPQPKNATIGTASRALESLAIEAPTHSSRSIRRAAMDRLLAGGVPTSPLPTPAHLRVAKQATLTVSVGSDSEELSAETDESYVLTVSVDGAAAITAPTVFGALHGLQSLAQVFELPAPAADPQPDRPAYLLRGLPWAIHDAPRFSHRAMLLDTSRHWLPLGTIMQHIDAMEMNKLNVCTTEIA
jgi:hexosaminidase